MVVAEDRATSLFVRVQAQTRTQVSGNGSPASTVISGAVAFLVVVVAFWAWWPAGIALGLVVGSAVVLHIGHTMHGAALAEPAVGVQALTGEEDMGLEFRLLRDRLGDDWTEFGRAARLVTEAQWASVAALQRELRITTAYAQHLMTLLEREGFVGPARGTRPRVVRLARDRYGDLERLLHA